MGFFSDIASEARRSIATPVQRTATPPAPPVAAPEAPAAQPVPPVAVPDAPTAQPVPAPQAPAEADTPPQADPAPSAHVPPPPPEVKLAVAKDAAQAPDDTAARQAHEAAEAKRKAEWDAKQAEKRAKRQAALDRIAAMNSAELLEAAVGRVAADTERLTRRNMKEAVAEYIAVKCREDVAFAMLVLDPEKSMIRAVQYINRKAKEFIEEAIKAENPNPENGIYGDDVPDGLVYQWAEDYFRDENAEEDHKDDEKFVPKPYVPPARKPSKAKAAKGKSEKKKPAGEKPGDAGGSMEQISLM